MNKHTAALLLLVASSALLAVPAAASPSSLRGRPTPPAVEKQKQKENQHHWNDDSCYTWRRTLYHQIPGHNIKKYQNIHLEECKNKCRTQDGCVSVDYKGKLVAQGGSGHLTLISTCYLQDVGINIDTPNYVQSWWGGYDNYELLPPKRAREDGPGHGASCINSPPLRPISTMPILRVDKNTPSYKCQHSQYIECPCNINAHLWQGPSTKCPHEFDPVKFERGDHDTCIWAGGFRRGGTTTGWYCSCPKVGGDAYSVDFLLKKKGDQCTNSIAIEG